MIIDCHTHIGRNEHINSSVYDLLKSMDKSGVDKSLVFAGEMNDVTTSLMLDEIKPYRDRFYGVASWDFDYYKTHRNMKPFEQEDYLCNLYKAGEIVAVKFYTGYYYFGPEQLSHILWRLNEIKCPAIFHMGDCLNSAKGAKLKYAQPLSIDDVAVDYPDMNFIIAHMGFPWHRDAAEVCYKNSNVYADISGFVYGDFKGLDAIKFKKVLTEFMEITDAKKLLFGTDFPISNQKSYVSTMDDMFGDIINCQSLSLNVKKAFNL
jgi:hypothetical protein